MFNKKTLSELDILTVLFFYSRNFHAYLLRLKPAFFEDEYQSFFETIQKYYSAYGKMPSTQVIETELRGEEKDEALKTYDAVYANHDKVKNLTHEYLLDKLSTFAKKCFLKFFMIKSYDYFEREEYDKVIQGVSQLNESIIDNDLGEEYHDQDFVDERYNPENYGDAYNTGFVQFDESDVKWYKKCLHIIAGPSNSGKTLWLINFAANLLLNQEQTGIKILYITLEIDEHQVGRRLDACLLEEPMHQIAQMRDLRLRELIEASKETRGNRLIIKEMPGYKTTPADIEAMIRNLDVTSNGELKPDIVIVDYIGLLSPTTPEKSMGLYEKGLSLSVELRSIAQRYDIPLIVAAQTNRASFEDRVGQDKIADSIGIAQTADLVMTINRNSELDEKNHVNIYLAKSRFCKNGSTFLFHVNYDCMRVDDIAGGATGTVETQEN